MRKSHIQIDEVSFKTKKGEIITFTPGGPVRFLGHRGTFVGFKKTIELPGTDREWEGFWVKVKLSGGEIISPPASIVRPC